MEQKYQKPTVVTELHYLSDLLAIYHNRAPVFPHSI